MKDFIERHWVEYIILWFLIGFLLGYNLSLDLA